MATDNATGVNVKCEPCKCCGSTGVQVGKDGIRIRCPACGGSGEWNVTSLPRWDYIHEYSQDYYNYD